MAKKLSVSVCVGGYDVTGDLKKPWTADELRIAAAVLLRGAEAIEAREHGTIESVNNLASVHVDTGGPFDDEKGLPLIVKIGKPGKG